MQRRLMKEVHKHQVEMQSEIDQKLANIAKEIQRNTTSKLQIENTIKQAYNQRIKIEIKVTKKISGGNHENMEQT